MIDAGEYDAAYAILEEIGNTEAIVANKYNRAMECIDAQNYETAYMLLDGLDYQDSAQKRKEIKSQYHSAVLMKTDVAELFSSALMSRTTMHLTEKKMLNG